MRVCSHCDKSKSEEDFCPKSRTCKVCKYRKEQEAIERLQQESLLTATQQGKSWSIQETDIVYEAIRNGTPYIDVAKRLGRTYKAILARAGVINVRLANNESIYEPNNPSASRESRSSSRQVVSPETYRGWKEGDGDE